MVVRDGQSIRSLWLASGAVQILGWCLVLTPSVFCAQTAADVPICADRPGLTTAACIEKPDHVQIESGELVGKPEPADE